jgi:hypothetical protein
VSTLVLEGQRISGSGSKNGWRQLKARACSSSELGSRLKFKSNQIKSNQTFVPCFPVTCRAICLRSTFNFLTMALGPLADLIQTIHHPQSGAEFVIVSEIDEKTRVWSIQLGLVGGDNRWWHGSWKEEHIKKLCVSLSPLMYYDMECWSAHWVRSVFSRL